MRASNLAALLVLHRLSRCVFVCARSPRWLTRTPAEDSKAFICWDCDEKEAGFTHGEHHLATHNLVRCMEPQKEAEATPEEDSTEKRLGAVEHKLEGLTSQMERIEKLLQSLTLARAE